MKLPSNLLTGAQLIKALAKLGYQPPQQAESHVRLTCQFPKEHHLTVPLHNPLRIGNLASILTDAATHRGIIKNALTDQSFGK